MIYVYFRKDKDERILIVAGMIYQLIEYSKQNFKDLFLTIHEGHIFFYTEDYSLNYFLNQKLGKGINLCNDFLEFSLDKEIFDINYDEYKNVTNADWII